MTREMVTGDIPPSQCPATDALYGIDTHAWDPRPPTATTSSPGHRPGTLQTRLCTCVGPSANPVLASTRRQYRSRASLPDECALMRRESREPVVIEIAIRLTLALT